MIKGSARFGFKCLFKLPSEELDSEVAGINHHKKNKDHENTNKIESEKDDSEVPEGDIIEEIEEIIESEDNIGEKQDKEFPEKHVSSRSICSMLLSINQIWISSQKNANTIQVKKWTWKFQRWPTQRKTVESCLWFHSLKCIYFWPQWRVIQN